MVLHWSLILMRRSTLAVLALTTALAQTLNLALPMLHVPALVPRVG